ncbi:hypothetical protein DVH05_001586 [Phytophthora capsici]|nr:hypothetical protein DVH05_001586 [Phytophthora capsici]
MYREDRNTTGNVPKDTAPPCLELMLEHWAPNPGMLNTTLLDGTSELDDAAMDNASSNEDQGRSSRKTRKKSNGECVEEVADGVKVVGEAMKTRASAGDTSALSQAVITSLERQEKALQQQTAAINELVRVLSRK